MKYLVTGSSGHLGEALVRTLKATQQDVVGIDIIPSPYTDLTNSITNQELLKQLMPSVDTVFHTATLHKPHVATHSKQEFIQTNIQGTLVLLEAAKSAGVRAFVFTSTTSIFGYAMRPPATTPAVWITEQVTPVPRNIYGVTKAAAEDLCQLFQQKEGLNCIILRTSRFFPEEDDDAEQRNAYDQSNAKVNELTFRRVDIEDVVSAHLLASQKAEQIKFGKYIISATTPFLPNDLNELRHNAPQVLRQRVPQYADIYQDLGWKMFSGIDRVYDNRAAREQLGWQPQYDFAAVLQRIQRSDDPRSELAQQIGSKGYHSDGFEQEPYPLER